MRVRERVYWAGSGLLGMNATDEWDCNVYILDGGHEQAIIDCGTGYGVGNILKEIIRDGFSLDTVQYVLLTHAHADHAGGAAEMKKWTCARAGASIKTAAMVERGDEDAIGLTQAKQDGIYPADYTFTPCEINLKVQEASIIQVGDLTLQVIETPGHSSDMVSYYCQEIKTLFCGDTVFQGGQIAALTTEDFSLEALAHSIEKLHKLEVESLMPGHLTPIVRGGHLPIEQALNCFRKNLIPRSIV